MKNIKNINIIVLLFSFIISSFYQVQPSLPQGSLVATPKGLVKVENLKVGNKVLSYNFNSTKTKTTLTEVKITKIQKHLLESGFSIYTGKHRWIDASPQHLFFALIAGKDKASNISVVADFVEAQYLEPGDMLIDVDMSCIPITKIRRADFCIVKKDKHGNTVLIPTVKIYAYAIEVGEPHTFLVSESAALEGLECRLLLAHNGIPALAAGLSFTFGSTPASISFAEASLAVGGFYASLGPVGISLGIFTGLGFVCYKYFFKSKKEKRIYLERVDRNYGSCCSPGGFDPNDPKDREDKKNGSKKIAWSNHKNKHVPPKNIAWKEIVKSTKTGDAKYKQGINVEELERFAWNNGQPVTNGKRWKVFKSNDVIGAKNGIETPYMRIEMSSNTIHGHPITPAEYVQLLK